MFHKLFMRGRGKISFCNVENGRVFISSGKGEKGLKDPSFAYHSHIISMKCATIKV